MKKKCGIENKGHRVGSRPVEETVVKEEKKPAPGVDAALTEHERFLILLGYQQATREFLKILPNKP